MTDTITSNMNLLEIEDDKYDEDSNASTEAYLYYPTIRSEIEGVDIDIITEAIDDRGEYFFSEDETEEVLIEVLYEYINDLEEEEKDYILFKYGFNKAMQLAKDKFWIDLEDHDFSGYLVWTIIRTNIEIVCE
jgi:hypothetical protein